MVVQKATLVIVITIVLVLLFNAAIFMMAKRRGEKSANQIRMIGRVFHRVRNPWEEEEAKLDELSQTVAKLKQQSHKEPDKGD
jgi:hypothetical protein